MFVCTASNMTIDEFKALSSPDELPRPLQALWYDARGDWDRAHEMIQASNGPAAERVHAYLHRKEGDQGNAAYWYSRVGEVKPNSSLDEEWAALVRRFSKRFRTFSWRVLSGWVRPVRLNTGAGFPLSRSAGR